MQASSHNPREDITLTNRLKTIFKKAYELSTLCAIEVCVVYYGPDGTLKTWPEEKEKVRDMALRYNAATKRKKSLNLREFLEDEKNKNKSKKKKQETQKKTKRELENGNGIKYPTWYPVFDHYSPDQLSELILSLERILSTLQERLRVVEAQKQRNTNLVHQQYQTQPLNPSQYSVVVYNHGDGTLSKLPITVSHANQLASYQNNFTQQQNNYGLGQNITNTNFQQPCFSNTQESSTLLTGQEAAVNNYLLKNNLIQPHELYGIDQNRRLMMNDITPSNVPCLSSNTVSDVSCSDFQKNSYGDMLGSSSTFSQGMSDDGQQHPCLSNNTVSDVSCSDFKNTFGDMVGSNSGFSQGLQDMFSIYDRSSVMQTSSLPSLQTIPNNYLLSNNSRFV